ncbi:hypothetical protein GQ55_2G431900 [Panicum hallii var. hallii]|uniref:Uncharacterized protein n=1 Tax=Panicum hallii var. hallii TaxID=1504633 RepID=A0A2T7EYI1_9POAL|nr:hypothetical protein GQ55_2G431900 [Panicum hallii var. hallii]
MATRCSASKRAELRMEGSGWKDMAERNPRDAATLRRATERCGGVALAVTRAGRPLLPVGCEMSGRDWPPIAVSEPVVLARKVRELDDAMAEADDGVPVVRHPLLSSVGGGEPGRWRQVWGLGYMMRQDAVQFSDTKVALRSCQGISLTGGGILVPSRAVRVAWRRGERVDLRPPPLPHAHHLFARRRAEARTVLVVSSSSSGHGQGRHLDATWIAKPASLGYGAVARIGRRAMFEPPRWDANGAEICHES